VLEDAVARAHKKRRINHRARRHREMIEKISSMPSFSHRIKKILSHLHLLLREIKLLQ